MSGVANGNPHLHFPIAKELTHQLDIGAAWLTTICDHHRGLFGAIRCRLPTLPFAA